MATLNYLLDTNVLSELTKPEPNPGVLRALARHRHQCATSAVVLHELQYGVARLADSPRKDRLRDFVSGLADCGMAILPYDLDAATWHARERARLEQAGLTPPFRDGQIAAVAASRHLTLVTRNGSDFVHFQALQQENWFAET